MNAAHWRLFLALWPDAVVREALGSYAASWGWPDTARRYGESDWHVTLQFLGALPQDRLGELRQGLEVAFQPFELRLDQAELWPHGLAVLGCSALPKPLQDLHDELAKALRGLGLEPESRSYRPHLTLARSAVGALMPPEPPAIAWLVRGYALVRSTGDARWRYDLLQLYPVNRCKPEPHLNR